MLRKNKPKRVYYFTQRLKKQLAQIHRYPLTIVEAPSGFGKTTAVREYLKENLPANAREYWYTCLGESRSVAWKSICELISHANDEISENLGKLKMPTMDTLLYMMAALRDFRCDEETYLVIDNFQLVSCDIPREMVNAFSMHGSSNLHMIFITQQLDNRPQFAVHNDNIHSIGHTAFFFDKEGTENLFLMEDIRLSESDLNIVYSITEGWVSAILLQIINFEESGSFDFTADIEHLVETAVWDRLSAEEKEFLLSVSVMDSFTARQAAIMMGVDILPEDIEELLKTNDFIRYFPDRGIYSIHGILQEYLQNRFHNYQSEAFRGNILRRAGRSYELMGQYYPAAQFFYRIGDFDAIFSMSFDGEYFMNHKENYLPEFTAEIVDAAPEEILIKYPSTMLTFCFQMFLFGNSPIYQKLCRLISVFIETNTDMNPERLREIKGEFAWIEALAAFNDIKVMGEGFKKALDILGHPTNRLKYEFPFTFGCTSVLFMFWRESGQLENEIKDLTEILPYYRRLTQGHGTGADSVMRAEAMLMQGEDEIAEVFCHKALYEAKSDKQTSLCLSAESVLARIAILRGDVAGFQTAIKNIRGYATENSGLYIKRMTDLSLTLLNLTLNCTLNVAQWVFDVETIKKALYSPVILYAQILHSGMLFTEKRYSEFMGIAQNIIDSSRNENGTIHYMMPLVYMHKYLAAIKFGNGKIREAQEHINQALEIALPDKIYLPFANQEGMDILLEGALETVSDFNKERLKDLIALVKRQRDGAEAIQKSFRSSRSSSPLTPREREVARLAQSRLTAKEIADELYISEATVKTILKSVYSKLDIHSKSELNQKEF